METGDILLHRGLLTEPQLAELRSIQRANMRSGQRNALRLDQLAVQQGFLNEETVLQNLGEELGIGYVDLPEFPVNLSLLKTFPTRFIHRERIFPIGQYEDKLVVATSDPLNLYPLDEVASITGKQIQPMLAPLPEIEKLIKNNLGVGSETIDGLMAQQAEEKKDGIELVGDIELDGSELSEMAQEPSVIRLVNEILLEAIESRASDIHIETESDGLSIRYRIDGVLHVQNFPSEINRFQSAIISRLKIMSKLNIAERRLPQDGRIQLKFSGREIDVRVSVIPMIHGESIVMRLLDKGAMEFSLRGLGMNKSIYDIFSDLIRLPHGIILVTGPTGSGKTTTLYSALTEIKDSSTKIITTEDPVEYRLNGISQIQVHAKIGLTFAASLRSILRHDPDIVLVGEIRDLETADNAVQAALTGHLVFSTLHTNDAAGAYTRLIDMGVEPFLVSSCVEAVMAQRLVRNLCPICKESYVPEHTELPPDFPIEKLQRECNGILYRPVGCRACRQVGYKGRSGIYELMVTSNPIREITGRNATAWEIKKLAVEAGMQTLRMDGWQKALRGETSIEEIVKVTKQDETTAAQNPELDSNN
ncbi:MAG: Flp pilus assembly complex ATPase component TadA [Planctomycetaceae bacterium]|jgi:general secretion pathway protein E/type IV pilus assembly protein PilB|nr:Flp pilus assembly complex ATPase component TadA [Planctomycetaceae bacterium]